MKVILLLVGLLSLPVYGQEFVPQLSGIVSNGLSVEGCERNNYPEFCVEHYAMNGLTHDLPPGREYTVCSDKAFPVVSNPEDIKPIQLRAQVPVITPAENIKMLYLKLAAYESGSVKDLDCASAFRHKAKPTSACAKSVKRLDKDIKASTDFDNRMADKYLQPGMFFVFNDEGEPFLAQIVNGLQNERVSK